MPFPGCDAPAAKVVPAGLRADSAAPAVPAAVDRAAVDRADPRREAPVASVAARVDRPLPVALGDLTSGRAARVEVRVALEVPAGRTRMRLAAPPTTRSCTRS